MSSKYKLVPVEPTEDMRKAFHSSYGLYEAGYGECPDSQWRSMLAAVPEVEPVKFCEDAALSLAERTFSTEVDEQLAEDIIQYARRLHSRYTAHQPTPEVAKLVKAMERLVFAAQCRDNSTGCQIRLIETRADLLVAVINAEKALSLYRQQGAKP